MAMIENVEWPREDSMVAKNQPSVAVILLNWNGCGDTLECIESLKSMDYNNFTIIVVDNGSREDIGEALIKCSNVELVRNRNNYGFAKGNNIGIALANDLGCEFCWILNNDTVAERSALREMIGVLLHDPSLAAVTNLILYYDDPTLSWFAGGLYKDELPAIKGYFEPVDFGQLQAERYTDTEYLCGCSFVARTEALKDVGGFDEAYFCYVEDIDLSRQLRQRGYKIGYVPRAVTYHKVSRSSGGDYSPLKLYYKHRNMLYYAKKYNLPIGARLRWLKSSFRSMVSLLLRHRKPAAAWHLACGLIDGQFGRMGKYRNF